MMKLSCEVIKQLGVRTIATAESCTGGMIGAALTSVPGSSAVYKGGIISYTNEVKILALGVREDSLERYGAVSAAVAEEMSQGVRKALKTDFAVSVTGLAGPGGDEYGNPVGTVYIGLADENSTEVRHYLFSGNRDSIRKQAAEAAMNLILEKIS